ncbi:hypothetical protein TNCV_3146891 [Trichonephila clavipes]|nr:hypothetical protein TNCV_3146891 [Trichonephila clavipes]
MEMETFLSGCVLQLYDKKSFFHKYDDAASGQKNPSRPLIVESPARLSEGHFLSHIPPTPTKRASTRQCKGGKGTKEKEKSWTKTRAGRFRKRRGESRSFLVRDADQESKTRIRKNALRTGPRQAVERATSKRGNHTG